ncbi:nickel pincer cofactor biosynthesis protein LarB [soil metagenome]
MSDPFAAIQRALDAQSERDSDGDTVRVDVERAARAGIPEIVLAGHKRDDDLLASVKRLLAANGRVMVSRIQPHQWALLETVTSGEFVIDIDAHREARVAVIRCESSIVALTGGRIAVISAGASDRHVAEEAALVAVEMGVEVTQVSDVGVAGLHRLVAPLREVMSAGVEAIVVAAGMDGALPSVVAGLVDVPVIGLPVSVGYGHGGSGEAALMSMLQSCAPGIAVVNIDNGIGAGSMAALIANRMAAARDSAT